MSLDRIDVNGNYEPSNCRWADLETQHTNKRPLTNERRRARDEAIRASFVPSRLERIEERMLRGIAWALRREFGPPRNIEISPDDFQVSECSVSTYEFRGLNTRTA
jgi:hypothetical protein